jgi:AraC-like DNA-binding protein
MFTPNPKIILPLFKKLATYHSYTRPMEIFKELSLFYQILELCFEALSPDKLLPASQNSFTKTLNPYIETHYQNVISIQELAALVNLSPNYFIQSFKQHYNETPVNYLNNYRLEKSLCYLFESGTRSIQDISYICGFSDYRYYSRLFKNKYGLSPGNYRKKSIEL